MRRRKTVHSVPAGTFSFTRPLTRKVGDVDRVLQGGLPPVAFRQASGKLGSAWGKARDPFACKQIRGEYFGDAKEWRKA